jgi:putative hydroxymethylpyrimidine transport system substrate-binding protein
VILRMDEIGVPTYNELVIVAREADVRSRGPVLRRFMRALARGHDALRKNTDVGVDALVKANPDLKASLQRAQVKATLPVFFPTDKDKPFGFQNPQEWRRYAVWMASNKLIADANVGQRAFTNEFLPGEGI